MINMPDPIDPTIIHELEPIFLDAPPNSDDIDDYLEFRIDAEITLSASDTHDALAPATCDADCPLCLFCDDQTR